MSIRIGIDVGGTFTDAVAIDDDSLTLLGFTKVFTTYHSKDGVASSIVSAISRLISRHRISPLDISFIACGTTQATNAILEGDVCDVGVISIGNRFAKFHDIHIGANKYIHVTTFYVNDGPSFDSDIRDIFTQISHTNIRAVVATCPFSPDNNVLEQNVLSIAREYNIYATATCDISGLYGIKIRTNTAIINASIMPKMVSTFHMIKQSITSMGITAPIMIMRCDGGIMSIDEITKRPFLTILSGPAASVYGALIYEKISTGMFLEFGGTSCDISIIKNGQVMLTHPSIGGHKLYLNSLDINTIALGGGSLIRVSKQKLDLGPRSSHILGLPYACFSDPCDLKDLSLHFVKQDNFEYATVKNTCGKTFSITLTCILNALDLVNKDKYCFGNQQSARLAMGPLADFFNTTVDDIAHKVLDIAINRCSNIVCDIAKAHKLEQSTLVLFGGGGACDPLISLVAQKIGAKWSVCKNSPIISSIGVCMSVIREVVERNVLNPTATDIKNIKLAACEKLSKSLANQSLIETSVEFDSHCNILRAISTSTVNPSRFTNTHINAPEIISLYTGSSDIAMRDVIGNYSIFDVFITKKILWGLFQKSVTLCTVIDNLGIIRFKKSIRNYSKLNSLSFLSNFHDILNDNCIYSDIGIQMPRLTLVTPNRIIDVSSFVDTQSILSFVECELDLTQSFDIICLIE